MRPRSLLLFGSLIVFVSACAKASGTGGEGGDATGPGSGGTTTGSNSTGSTTTTGSNTTTTGSNTTTTTGGNTTTTTGSGPGCAEDPCKLTIPQCGCAAGEQCSVDATGRGCIPVGNVANGQVCTGPDCGVGLLCLQQTASVSTCGKFCATDSDCVAPGGLCLLTLNDGNGGSIPDVTLCTENCDPTTNVGCAGAGTSCQIAQEASGQMRFLTHCTASGAGQQGAVCTTSAECAPKFGCYNTDPNVPTQAQCLKQCKASAPNGCSAGTTCQFFSTPVIVGSEEYGACL